MGNTHIQCEHDFKKTPYDPLLLQCKKCDAYEEYDGEITPECLCPEENELCKDGQAHDWEWESRIYLDQTLISYKCTKCKATLKYSGELLGRQQVES